MNAMILAAGFGARLRPYTLARPKPLFPVLHTPLLTIILKQLRDAGCVKVVVNCHHLGARIEELIGFEKDVILQREAEILGTGGGLRRAMDFFGTEPVLVVNGDIFHSIDLKALYRFHLKSGASATLALHDHPALNSVTVDKLGFITGFARFGALPAHDHRFTFTGLQVVNPDTLTAIPADTFYDIIELYQKLIATGSPIAAFVCHQPFWSDMGSCEEYLALHHALLLHDPLPAGLPQYPGKRPFFIDATAHIGRGCRFHDWVCVGPGASIGDGAELSRTVVWDGATVANGELIADAIIMNPLELQ